MYSSSVNLDKSIGDIEPSFESRDSDCALSSRCFWLRTFEIRIEVHVSFGEIRDDRKTKVHSYQLHAFVARGIAFGTKEKRNNTVCPVQRRFIINERDGSRMRLFLSLQMGERRFLPTT